jgi:hypothetical protein
MSVQHMLIWYMPVIHQGYLNYWQQLTREYSVANLSLVGISPALAAKLQSVKTDPATLNPEAITMLWKSLSGQDIIWLDEDFFSRPGSVANLLQTSQTAHLVDDVVSRQFWQLCVEQIGEANVPAVQWHSVFLRWDADSVQQMNQVNCPTTSESTAQKWMEEAKKQCRKKW